jgi:hypothetical protein
MSRTLLDFAADVLGFDPIEKLIVEKPLADVYLALAADDRETTPPPRKDEA